jgi:uncharacterized lipoprotein YddW (UPF0748 family)
MSSNLSFSDIQNHWAQDCIRQLAQGNIITGYPDGSFRPNASVTRAEFAALLGKAFANTPPVRDNVSFKDVPANHWANSAIQSAYQKGFLSGFPDRTFQPDQFIPRVQALVALVSGLKYTVGAQNSLQQYYNDAAEIPIYALGAIATATQKRLVVNYPNIKRLSPNQSATRAEVVAFICRALKIPGVPFQYIPGMEFVVIPPQFEQADAFSEGLARVKIGEKWGYIDKTGKQVIQPQLDEANSFSEGHALVRTYSLKKTFINSQEGGVTEIRGVWLTNVDSQVLNSQQSIAEAMNFLAETGFNVVFPVVWNNAATLYPSRVMRETFGYEINSRYAGRDPLGELVTEAKRVGLAVIPWFEYGFASSYNQNGGRLIAKKPEWAARDFRGNLLKKNEFEWMNALDEEVQNFILSLILEVAKNYDVAGIQGDDRLPALPSEGSYDTKTTERYLRQFNQNPPQNFQEAQWLQWRADILTDFLTRLFREVISVNPNLIISVSPSVYPWALQEYLQDTQAWTDQGLVDLINPQLYQRGFEGYKQLVDRLVTQQFTSLQLPTLAPGILLKVGSYRITPELLLQKVQYNRDRGIMGEVFFFYEGLREDNNALANVLREGPYAKPALFKASALKKQGFTERRISGQYSYIDLYGKSKTQPSFDWVDSFKDGVAPVKMGYKWGYIDKAGNRLSRFQFDEANLFSEGLSLVRVSSKYGYIDKTSKVVIPIQYDQAQSFQEGLAAVKLNSAWGYIDKIGKAVILPQYDEAGSFSGGLALIKTAGKYGYIDTTGKVIIQPQFDVAGSFSEGLARVKIGEKWGYINSIGQTVVTLPFVSAAESFSEGLAAVKINGLWGYIDKNGQVTISPEFTEAKSFREGLALVSLGSKWGYIRKS